MRFAARSLALALLALPLASFAQSGPVAAYGLNAAGGTRAADYSGNGLNGEFQTGAAWTTAGKFGGGLLLNGQSGFVDLGNPAALQLTGSMTLSAWIYSTGFPSDDAAIVSKFDGLTPRGWQLDTTVDTGVRTVGFKLSNASGFMIRYGATVLQLNQWYHVTGVYDANAQTLDVYLNGVPDNGDLVGTVTSTQVDAPLNAVIGERADYQMYPFIGTIDEVRIYNRALTQAQVSADMNAPIVPATADTVAPTAPSSLIASAASNTQINLAWGDSSDNYDVTVYRVERCQGAGCTNFAEIGTAFDVSFVDSGLAVGASYSYRVRSADGTGNLSAYSNVASTATLSVATVDGRVGAYPFEEGSGTSTADLSGLGNVGTLQGGVTWTTAGQFGKALTFTDGTWVDLGNPGPLQLTGSMTVSAWVKASSFPADDAAIVSKLTNDPPHGFQLDATVDTGVRTIGFKLSNVVGYMIRYGATELQLNTWYFVAGVYDAGAKTMNVYLNGVLDNGNSFGTVSSSQKDSPLSVNIGRRASGAYGFPGTIDEVRIYNRALSQAEIQADMAVSASTPPDGTPPSAPSALTANAVSQTEIDLSWTASTDNVAVAGYRVERCQGAGCTNFAQIATSTVTTFADTGLTAATSYSYRVRAADGAGNLSAYSNIASATTAGAVVGAQMYFIQTDHLNTPRLIATSTGTTVWRWDQGEPFGNDVPNNNPSGAGAFDFPLRLPGQYFDRETNLTYNYRRDYDPTIGRYVQSDPAGLDGGINTYTYAVSDPLLFVDPDGLDIQCPAVFDTGPYDLASHGDRCYLKGKRAYFRFQYRYQDIGTLIGESGSCGCGEKNKTCVYSLVFKSWIRDTPCGGGPWSPWRPFPDREITRPLKAVIDCKTGEWDPSKFMLGEIGPIKPH